MDDIPSSVAVGQPAPPALADATLRTAVGGRFRLGDLWADGPALIVFLRHFACTGCRQNMEDLRPRLEDLKELGVAVGLIGCDYSEHIPEFSARWSLPETGARVWTDPTGASQHAAGMHRSWWRTWSPGSLVDRLRGRSTGDPQVSSDGDRSQLPGAILLDGAGIVRLVHRGTTLGDFAPAEQLVAAVRALDDTGG